MAISTATQPSAQMSDGQPLGSCGARQRGEAMRGGNEGRKEGDAEQATGMARTASLEGWQACGTTGRVRRGLKKMGARRDLATG